MPKNFGKLASSTLRVGVIGLGRQSLNDHIPALLRRRDVEIVCVSDISITAHKAFFDLYPDLKGKVKAYRDFQDVIKERYLYILPEGLLLSVESELLLSEEFTDPGSYLLNSKGNLQ